MTFTASIQLHCKHPTQALVTLEHKHVVVVGGGGGDDENTFFNWKEERNELLVLSILLIEITDK